MSSAPFDPGISILDLFAGLSTVLVGAVRSNMYIRSYHAVEIDPHARAMAEHMAQTLLYLYPASFAPGALDGMHSLPQDVEDITIEHLKTLPPIDLFHASWPCQGLSRANRSGQGLSDPRSGLFEVAHSLLGSLCRVQPTQDILMSWENVDFEKRHPEDWAYVCSQLGPTRKIDAAAVSYAHRLRCYWWSWKAPAQPTRREDRELASVLEAHHHPNKVERSDRPPYLPFNVAGQPRRKHPTVVATADTFNVRDGTALVINRTTALPELPTTRELERIMGFYSFATAAPGVPDTARRHALGNAVDANMWTWALGHLAADRPSVLIHGPPSPPPPGPPPGYHFGGDWPRSPPTSGTAAGPAPRPSQPPAEGLPPPPPLPGPPPRGPPAAPGQRSPQGARVAPVPPPVPPVQPPALPGPPAINPSGACAPDIVAAERPPRKPPDPAAGSFWRTSWGPSERAKLKRVLVEIREFPPPIFPQNPAEAETFSPGAASRLRFQLLHTSFATLTDALHPWASRLRLRRSRFQGQLHHYLIILDAAQQRRLLTLRVPPLQASLAQRQEHATRQEAFLDDEHGIFLPGTRLRPAAWAKYGVSEEVISRLTEGFPLKVAYVPRPFYQDNHASFYQFGEAGEADFQEVSRRHFQEGPLLGRPFITNPMAIVETGKLRTVLDATRSGLNAAQLPISYSADTVELVIQCLHPQDRCGKLDLKDAFRHWPMPLGDADWVGVKSHDGQFYRQRFVAFGVAQAPAIQQEMADLIKWLLNTHCLSPGDAEVISAYVDDFVMRFAAHLSPTRCHDIMQDWLRILADLGLEVKDSKTIWPTSDPIPVLGLLVDTTNMRVSVSQERREKYRRLVLHYLATVDTGAHTERRPLASLVGKLNFLASVVLGGLAHLADLSACIEDLVVPLSHPQKSFAWGPKIFVIMSAQGRRALHFWSEQLQQNPSRQYFAATPTSQGGFWLGQITDSHADMDIGSRTHNGIIVITMDASGDQGGAWFHDQEGVLQECVHSFPARHSKGRASSNFREFSMIHLALEAWAPQLRAMSPCRVLLRTDNTLTLAAINRQTSTSPLIRKLLLRTLRLGAALGLQLAAKHIPGVENIRADRLSRETPPPGTRFIYDRDDWRVFPAIFALLSAALGPFDKDACADPSGSNSLCDSWWSSLDPALSHPWTSLFLWVNPIFSDWPAYVTHFLAASRESPYTTSAVFVLPVWEKQEVQWRCLKKARVLGFFPAGSSLFDAPVRINQDSDARHNIGPTPFPVIVLWFPQALPPVASRSATMDIMESSARRAAFAQELPTLSGHRTDDIALLHSLPPGVLPCLLRGTVPAAFPVHPLPAMLG